MGRHLLFTNWRVTFSEDILPTLPKIAFVDRLNERFASVTEHLNCRPLIMYARVRIVNKEEPERRIEVHRAESRGVGFLGRGQPASLPTS